MWPFKQTRRVKRIKTELELQVEALDELHWCLLKIDRRTDQNLIDCEEEAWIWDFRRAIHGCVRHGLNIDKDTHCMEVSSCGNHMYTCRKIRSVWIEAKARLDNQQSQSEDQRD